MATRKLTIRFSLENAAFRHEDDSLNYFEISRALQKIAKQIENGSDGGSVRDINGNTVGEWKIT